MSVVRLYGHSVGHGSWPRVTAGLRTGLSEHGLLGGCHWVDDSECETLGDEPIAIYVGAPSSWQRMTTFGRHKHRWVVLAPNSTWLPKSVIEELYKYATLVLAPSTWARGVIMSHVGDRLPVVTLAHGVDKAFVPRRDELHIVRDSFRVLHMTSTSRQRKGTAELVEAWKQFYGDAQEAKVELTIVADHLDVEGSHTDGIVILPRCDLAPDEMGVFYRQFSFVCQPSRAEGFGMVPLEALASGVPIILTDCTGHREYTYYRSSYTSDHAIKIPVGDAAPIDDGPGALAPTVVVNDVFDALVRAYRDDLHGRKGHAGSAYYSASMQCHNVVCEWSWYKVLKDYGVAKMIKQYAGM